MRDFWDLVIDLTKSFRLIDLLDIAIITVLIFGAVRLVRESRAGQLVKGIVILLVLYLLSIMLELSALQNIINYLFQYAFIALLIVFQPEIRKALEQMGRSNVGKSIAGVMVSRDNENSVLAIRVAINSTVEAISVLQNLRMGAIIVFERSTKLGDIIETGTMVNATPSAKMISNIFYNKAPLHDGAMVIRNGNIISAGCILPLTKNDAITANVGTRHRAAIGMSEESDAVVVVLSEETGKISTAVNGELKRDYTKDTLREYLESILENEVETVKVKNPFFKKKRGAK